MPTHANQTLRPPGGDGSFDDEAAVNETLAALLLVMEKLDERIGPMLETDGRQFNRRWVQGSRVQGLTFGGTVRHCGMKGMCEPE